MLFKKESKNQPNVIINALSDEVTILIPNRTFLVRFGGIIGEFGGMC